MGMYPSTPVTFIAKSMGRGRVSVQQNPRETRRSGTIGSPMGTSAIVLMIGSRRALLPLPISLSQPRMPLNGMIEGK